MRFIERMLATRSTRTRSAAEMAADARDCSREASWRDADLPAGTVLEPSTSTVKKPGTGIPAERAARGASAAGCARDLGADELLR